MRIAFWSHGYFRGIGGAEKMVCDLLHELSREKMKDLILISHRHKNGRRQNPYFRELPSNVEVYQNRFPNPLLNMRKPFSFICELIHYFIASIQLFFFLKNRRVDIVHLHLVNIDVFILISFKFFFRYQLISTFTGMEIELARSHYVSKVKLLAALRFSDAVTAVSTDICSRLNEYYGYNRALYIPNGMKIPMKSAASEVVPPAFQSDQLLFCGRLVRVKRLHLLIQAYRDSIPLGMSKHLYIIGDGEEEENIGKMINRLNLTGRVHLLGAIPHDLVLQLMRDSRCLLLSSSSEACPMVVLEAMMAGIPVIAPDVGGLKDLIRHGSNGYLFEYNNIHALSDFMLEIVNDTERAKEMGRAGGQILSNEFNLSHVVRQYIRLYHDVLPYSHK